MRDRREDKDIVANFQKKFGVRHAYKNLHLVYIIIKLMSLECLYKLFTLQVG